METSVLILNGWHVISLVALFLITAIGAFHTASWYYTGQTKAFVLLQQQHARLSEDHLTLTRQYYELREQLNDALAHIAKLSADLSALRERDGN